MAGALRRRIERTLDRVRADIMPELMPDTFELLRGGTPVSDGAGGVTYIPNVVLSGPCSLQVTQQAVTETGTDVVIGRASYTAQLPLAINGLPVEIKATDTLCINGREFAISGPPKQGGEWALTIVVDLEARS